MYRIAIWVLLVLGVIGTVLFKINSLNNKVGSLTATIDKKNAMIDNKNLSLAIKDKTIKSLQVKNGIVQEDLELCRTTIEEYATTVNNLKVEVLSNSDLEKLLEESKRKPEVIYVPLETKIIEGDCEAGLELNRRISETSYEDL